MKRMMSVLWYLQITSNNNNNNNNNNKFLYSAIYSYKLLRALATLSRNIYNTIQYN